MSNVAPPQIWIVKLNGHEVVMQSYRDDSFEYTKYEHIPRDFSYLNEKQLEMMKWLLEQSYPVMVDVEKKVIARESSRHKDEVIENLNMIANDEVESPAWVDAIKDVNEYAKDVFDSLSDSKNSSNQGYVGY